MALFVGSANYPESLVGESPKGFVSDDDWWIVLFLSNTPTRAFVWFVGKQTTGCKSKCIEKPQAFLSTYGRLLDFVGAILLRRMATYTPLRLFRSFINVPGAELLARIVGGIAPSRFGEGQADGKPDGGWRELIGCRFKEMGFVRRQTTRQAI